VPKMPTDALRGPTVPWDRRRHAGTAAVMAAALLLVACGGGGGGGVGGAGPGARATVVFPPASASVDGESVMVRGTAVVDAGTVAAVRVNGVAATSTDGFRTWTAAVPISPGTADLVVETETDGGTVDPRAASVPVRREGGFEVLALPEGGAPSPQPSSPPAASRGCGVTIQRIRASPPPSSVWT
jgi:hypothetical protein